MRKHEHIIWGMAYILFIPIFALIYHYYLPFEFFHSTSQFEKTTLNKDSDEICKQIKYEMFGDRVSIDTVFNNEKINFQGISVTSLHQTDSTINFYLNYNLINETKSKNEYIEQVCGIDKKICCKDLGKYEPFYLRRFYIEPKKRIVPINIDYWFLNTNNRKTLNDPSDKLISFSLKLNEDLSYYVNALSGFPSKTTGNFPRMLYFSTITITTVGFGDIVPLTNRARLLVGLESFLGVITIGLFLNSLANKISKK